MSQISDQELIKGYLNGNEQALAVLLDRYIKPLHTFVYHLVGGNSEADDVVQETCVKLWRSLKKYDSQKNFKTWIFQIAKNTAIDYLRKKRPSPFYFRGARTKKCYSVFTISYRKATSSPATGAGSLLSRAT